jgi:hypothetical protein
MVLKWVVFTAMVVNVMGEVAPSPPPMPPPPLLLLLLKSPAPSLKLEEVDWPLWPRESTRLRAARAWCNSRSIAFMPYSFT